MAVGPSPTTRSWLAVSLLVSSACGGSANRPLSVSAAPCIPAPAPGIAAVPLDLPVAITPEARMVFTVVLALDGSTEVDAAPVANDDAILNLARVAHETNREIRAVIKADAAVTHGRVVHTMDLLKQGGITKIAFGVTPLPAGAAPAK